MIYHVAIGFQPWGIIFGFITNVESWQSLWLPMTLVNIWRIPFLFLVSGMGVYFSMRRRSWRALIQERSLRILLPYVFGMICIFPVSVLIRQHYYHRTLHYSVSPGHLWFLWNIFAYVLLLSPLLFYLRNNQNGKLVAGLKTMLSTPLGLIPVIGLFVAEVLAMKPHPYELYATTRHGVVLGALAFFVGFCFALCGHSFSSMLLKWRWLFLVSASGLFVIRSVLLRANTPGYLLPVETNVWILSVLAFGYRHLNHPGKALSYLSQAAYPVYILHLIFLFLGSSLIFPLALSAPLKFVVVLAFTVAGCFTAFELIRRVSILRPLFGLKMQERPLTLGEDHQGLAQA